MTLVQSGNVVPHDGPYKHPITNQVLELKAGEKFPIGEAPDDGEWSVGGKKLALKKGQPFPAANWAIGELRGGDAAPKDGVYFNMKAHTEHALKAGDKFPGGPENDFVWARE